MSNTIYTNEQGEKFRCTQAQADTIEKLKTIIAGGIGTVHGYMSTSERIVPEVSDMQFITNFSIQRLYERKIAALRELTFEDIKDFIPDVPKVQVLSEAERIDLFNDRREKEIASMEKTLDGDRSDNYRQAHDRVYCHVDKGLKVHFHTVKEDYIDAVGKKKKRSVPELIGGLPVAKSINLMVLVLNKTVIQKGEYVKRDSGAPVLIGNAIQRGLNSRSVSVKSLSLQEDNFSSLVVSRKTFLAEEFESIPADLFIAA